MRHARALSLALLFTSSLVACSASSDREDSPVDTGVADTAVADTGSAIDSTVKDSGSADTGASDSGAADGGTADSGGAADTTSADTSPTDTGTADTGTADTGATDTGTADTGTADTGPADTTPADTAPTDTGAADTTVADSGVDASDTSTEAATFGSAPTCDGTVASGEYGSHVEGQNQYTSASQSWFLTWDDTNLYVAVANANVAEGAVLYLDKSPLSPPTSGSDTSGNLAGQVYDGAGFSSLGLRADLVVYVKDGYREYRTANGTGGWSAAVANTWGCFAKNGTTRELAIPWSAIGGRPASFAFFAYLVSGTGFVYGEAPTALPQGSVGTTATANAYFLVGNSAPGGSKPFATALP